MKRAIETKILDPRLGTDFPLPSHATDGAAGLDIRACIEAPLTLEPGSSQLIHSGFAINIEDPGVMAVLVARSGLGVKRGIVVSQAVGVIDSDYHGEVLVSLWNRSSEPFVVEPGERICQMIFVPVIQAELKVVENFSVTTARGSGGFGSTGRD